MRPRKYHQLTDAERLQFHFVRYWYAYWVGDYFEAYRQSCIGASVACRLSPIKRSKFSPTLALMMNARSGNTSN